jgi:hypothetical protein
VADHYIVQVKKEDVIDGSYTWHRLDKVEIQVVSILFHAWAEVEHQIKYKRIFFTEISNSETRMLDCLRAVVGSGDLLLEELYHLQSQNTNVFQDKYGLGKFLLDHIPKDSRISIGDNREIEEAYVGSLWSFLKVFKMNSPEILSRGLSPLCKEEDSEQILDKIDAKYKPFKPKPQVYIMDYVLSLLSRVDQISMALETERSTNPDSYRCRTVLSALIWLGELFDDVDEVNNILLGYYNTGRREHESLEWAYKGIARVPILNGEEAYICHDRDRINDLWAWLEKQKDNPLALVFNISRLGVLKTDLSQLRSRMPLFMMTEESSDDES